MAREPGSGRDAPPASTTPLLRLSELSTHLGSDSKPVRAVDSVSFSINRGETFVLLGESMLEHNLAEALLGAAILIVVLLAVLARARWPTGRMLGWAVVKLSGAVGDEGRAGQVERDLEGASLAEQE